MEFYTAMIVLLRVVAPVAIGALALLVLWRIMKAQEEIARQLAAIAQKMGGGA